MVRCNELKIILLKSLWKKRRNKATGVLEIQVFFFTGQQCCVHSRGNKADSNSFSVIRQWGHISKRQNSPPLERASVSPLSFHWHIYCSSQMQLVARKVGGVMHAGSTPWVRMIRSGLEPQGFFLCFSAVKHLLNISEAAARILWPRRLFLLVRNSFKYRMLLKMFVFKILYCVEKEERFDLLPLTIEVNYWNITDFKSSTRIALENISGEELFSPTDWVVDIAVTEIGCNSHYTDIVQPNAGLS